jgi:hypothetical protein
MKLTCLFLFFLLLDAPPFYGSTDANPVNPKGIELKLSVSRGTLSIGGKPVTLRVEFWNRGPDPIVISEALSPYVSSPAYMVIDAINEKGERLRLWQLQSMGITQIWWNRVLPGHFYGTEYELDTAELDVLKNPGTYRLIATYISWGEDQHCDCENRPKATPIWKGKLESNAVNIRVLKQSRRSN